LPYLTAGPLAGQWAVRARTFDALKARVVAPLAKERGRVLAILDLGAGNGWLSARLAREGHRCVALDLRVDDVDGLAAGAAFRLHLPRMFARVSASFDALPFREVLFDLVVFDASLHLTEDLAETLAEAARATAAGGRVAILDSPFYARRASGEAMAEEKRRDTERNFRDLAGELLALTPVEYLTPESLARAAAPAGLSFERIRVLYPLAYETRAWKARLLGRREPSRFDLWVARRA
jgi:SAM-dependent methyltransferase